MKKRNDVPLLQRIADNNGSFSPKQLVLAKFVEHKYAKLAYVTLKELANQARVSDTTVVRFVSSLGYSGFPEFMTALRQTINTAASANAQMSRFTIEHGKYKFPQDICRAIFGLEMQIMQETLAQIDPDRYQQAVDMLYNASEVFVVGCGANKCCADAMSFALQVIRKDVRLVEQLDLNEIALIKSASRKAVAVVFITPRYPSAAVRISKLMHERGVQIIGVTDSLLSPIVPYCDIFFQAPEKYLTFIDTNASYMALIHSLVYSLHFRDKAKSEDNIAEYATFTKEIEFYVNSETELVDVDLTDL